MRHLRWTGLFAAGSLLVFGIGCPPEEDPDPDPPDEAEFEVQFAGENQVPPVATPAEGTLDVEFEDDTLTLNGNFDGLVAELQEVEGAYAHIHEGTDDEDGPILYNIEVDADGDNRGGSFDFEQDLTDEEVDLFATEEMYVNIHTDAYPDGELRAQIDENAAEYADVTDSWGVDLDADQHVHDVDTEGDGWAWNVLRDDDSFVSSGAANNLTSDVTEVTMEAAPEGEVGDVVFTFEHEMMEDEEDVDTQAVRFWLTEDLTDDQITVLEDGHYYINVYTEEFEEDGELRGQVDDDAGFWEDLFGTNEELDAAPPF